MSRTKIYLAATLVSFAIAGLGYYSYISPTTTLENIKKAAQQNDKDRLRDLIDFDSVKTGLKEDLKAQMVASTAESLKDNPFAALGVALASMIVDPLIESIVSPAGITRLVEEGRIQSTQANPGNPPSSTSAPRPTVDNGMRIQYGYDDFSRYRVRIRHPGMEPDQALTLTLRREGLFSWKLTRVSIPTDLLGNVAKVRSPNLPHRPDLLSIKSSDLQAAPGRAGVILLTAVIRNTAPFAQELPAIELTLTDAGEQPLVRRVLRPEDYLPGLSTRTRAHGIAANTETMVRLHFDTGNVRPTGYRLYVFYPAANREPATVGPDPGIDPVPTTRELNPEKIRIAPG